ncbi:MAG: dihydroxyacetone kinase subunit L [Caldilinea sp. CFX5]|nr:dihydroxyacetone kinase subunit L [Caldilinea sp. CFX5]
MEITQAQLIQWLEKCAAVLEANKAYLTELDSPIGDADHGANIARGFATIVTKLPTVTDKDIGQLLKMTGMTLMSAVGGASGLLYGNFFLKAAPLANNKTELTAAELVQLLEAGQDGIVQRGRAVVGDKTMIDAWTPAINALRDALNAGQALPDALVVCVAAAESGMKNTIPLQARKGRASYLGERSIGHQDPGATSTHLILQALLDTMNAG